MVALASLNRRDTVGLFALAMLNLLALAYDGQWLYVAVGLDAATVGAYLGVRFAATP